MRLPRWIWKIQKRYCWGSVPCMKKGQFDVWCSCRAKQSKKIEKELE